MKYFLRKSSAGSDDVLKNLSNRNYGRLDDRTYGREEQYYRDPAITDSRYNNNYNSYRGNGKPNKISLVDPSR